jgi:MraZ protein
VLTEWRIAGKRGGLAVFWGEHAISVDEKGRIALPTQYREALKTLCDQHVVVTYNPFDTQCLWLYPKPDWERVAMQMVNWGEGEESERYVRSRFLGGAHALTLDAAGRITLPATSRQTAGIDRQAMLLGIGQKFEIWSEATHRARLQQPIPTAAMTPELRRMRF